MRSLLATLAAFVLLCTAVGGVAAAGAFKESDHVRDIGCSNVDTPDGPADFYASLSDIWGADGYLDVYEGEIYNSDLVWSRDYERPVSASFTSTSADVTIPLLPSGEAHIVASLEAADTFSFTDNFREGNFNNRFKVAGTAFSVTGTLTLPGNDPVSFGPIDCGGGDALVETFFNQPHSAVRAWSSTSGTCELTNSDGDTALVFMDLFEEETFLFLDAFVQDGADAVSTSGAGDVIGGSVSMALDEYDPEDGVPTGDTGSASLSLTESADDVKYVLRGSNLIQRVTGSLVNVAGSLRTSLGSFDLDPCVIAATRHKEVLQPSNGPKPTGKRPANDLPAGAITLNVGGKATTSTRGAQESSEVRYPCMEFEDFDGTLFVIPVEHTVWYKVTGTGSPITVDTAGSDFDTVVAVYAGAANADATVVCVDDSPVNPFGRTLQASATFPTVAGTTYWIQIGGFQEDAFGEDSPLLPYGNLRVAVR